MAKITPAMGTSGEFELLAPFVTIPGAEYTVKGVRTFDDIYRNNVDVFKTYYEPRGLNQSQFEADVAAGAFIITLMANDIGAELAPNDPNTLIYVPDTYIATFPNGDNVPYSQIILSSSLGALPDYLDLTDVINDIEEIIAAKVGIAPVDVTVNINKAKLMGTITTDIHQQMEEDRELLITNHNTIYSQYYALNEMHQLTLEQYTQIESEYIKLLDYSGEDRAYLESIGYYTIDLNNSTSPQIVYIDAKFFNKIKIDVDLSSFPVGSYLEFNGASTINGSVGTITGNIIKFTVDSTVLTGTGAVFNFTVRDSNDFPLDTFNVNLEYVHLATATILDDLTLDFDLTEAGPHTQRLYFNQFVRTERLLKVAGIINDPFDPDEPYYILTGTQTGITYMYGKNWIDITVDESSYLGNIDTTVGLAFLSRYTNSGGSNVDTNATFTIHITNEL